MTGRMFFAALACLTSNATALSLAGDMRMMEGKTITYAGEFEEVICPSGGKYDCLSWPRTLLRMSTRDRCFQTSYYGCGYSCNGFVVVDKQGNFEAFFLRDLLGVEQASYRAFRCPDLY